MVNKMPGEHQHGALPLCLSDPTNTWASDVLGGTSLSLMVLVSLGLWDTSPSPAAFVCIRCKSSYSPDSCTVLGSDEHCYYFYDKLLTPELLVFAFTIFAAKRRITIQNLQQSNRSGLLPRWCSWTSFTEFFLNQACQILHNDYKYDAEGSCLSLPACSCILHAVRFLLFRHLMCLPHFRGLLLTGHITCNMSWLTLYKPWLACKGGWLSSCHSLPASAQAM